MLGLFACNWNRRSPFAKASCPLKVSAAPIHASVLASKNHTPSELVRVGVGGGGGAPHMQPLLRRLLLLLRLVVPVLLLLPKTCKKLLLEVASPAM